MAKSETCIGNPITNKSKWVIPCQWSNWQQLFISIFWLISGNMLFRFKNKRCSGEQHESDGSASCSPGLMGRMSCTRSAFVGPSEQFTNTQWRSLYSRLTCSVGLVWYGGYTWWSSNDTTVFRAAILLNFFSQFYKAFSWCSWFFLAWSSWLLFREHQAWHGKSTLFLYLIFCHIFSVNQLKRVLLSQ